MAEARTELERAERLGLDSSTDDLVTHMMAYFLLDEPQQVQRIMAKLSGRPDEFIWRPRPWRDAAILWPVPHGGGDHTAGF
jgi:hypothetical protein